MVEQFGLAMMPSCEASASGLTSATTSGTRSSMRQREELSITVAPAAAKRGAHSPDVEPPAENSARSKPWIDSSSSPRTVSSPSGPSIVRPTERSEANGTISARREPALAEQPQHQRADLPGRAHDRHSVSVAHALRVQLDVACFDREIELEQLGARQSRLATFLDYGVRR